jgi:hypothetical protein
MRQSAMSHGSLQFAWHSGHNRLILLAKSTCFTHTHTHVCVLWGVDRRINEDVYFLTHERDHYKAELNRYYALPNPCGVGMQVEETTENLPTGTQSHIHYSTHTHTQTHKHTHTGSLTHTRTLSLTLSLTHTCCEQGEL